ncbi:hypothetical protein LPJ57_000633 [Coemansia sp. RSA 486]|nr:hypothetical protein LPJ57_000633 [Coemansia sp. RSA 486]KAJ2600436.1 hypothetical protein GGF39_001777 [Coemansia sp. RSA 1721]
MPIIGIIGAGTYHHFKTRKSKNLVPFKNPSWINHLRKISFVYTGYSIFKGLVPMITGADALNVAAGGGTGAGSMIARVLGKLLGGVFGTDGAVGGTRDIGPSDYSGESPIIDTFSPNHAVHRSMAEHYYNGIYHGNRDTNISSPQTLGGAAAIRVLNQEEEIYRNVPPNVPMDQVLIGCVMAEVERLLLKDGAQRNAEDLERALENVGRVALSTMVNIKRDQGRGLWERNSEPGTRREFEYAEGYEQPEHDDGRRHRRSRRHRAQSYDYNDHYSDMGYDQGYERGYGYEQGYEQQYRGMSSSYQERDQTSHSFNNDYSHDFNEY